VSRSISEVSVPTTELVTPADLSTLLQGAIIDDNDPFALLCCSGARQMAEDLLGYYLTPRDFVQYADRFPIFAYPSAALGPLYGVQVPQGTGPITSYPAGFASVRNPFDIALLANPVQSVAKITYKDLSGATQELDVDTDFTADLSAKPARVSPLPNAGWPVALPGPQSVRIYFTAGFAADPNAIQAAQGTHDARVVGYPQKLKLLVLQLAGHWWITRDITDVPQGITNAIISCRLEDFNPSME